MEYNIANMRQSVCLVVNSIYVSSLIARPWDKAFIGRFVPGACHWVRPAWLNLMRFFLCDDALH